MDNIEVKEQANKEATPQAFAEAYQSLCEEMGFRLVVSPTWVSTNHRSFELVLQYTVGQLPKEKKEVAE